MEFQGLNLRVDENDLPESLSPDTSNCFLFDGKVGEIGGRAGKTFFNSTAYDDNTLAILQFYTPAKRSWLVADSNGTVTERTQAYAYTAPGVVLTRRLASLATPLSVTVTQPTLTGSASGAFATALPAMTGVKLVGFFLPSISATYAQTNPSQGTLDITVEMGLTTSIGGTRWHTAWTTQFKRLKNGAGAGVTINPVQEHDRIGNRFIIGSAYQTGDGTITGIELKLTCAYTNLDSASVTVSGFDTVLELD